MARDIELNWEPRVEKSISVIKQWSKPDLSIVGKVIICKTFLLSQLVYIMQSIGIPEKILNQINTILFRFLWKKKYNNKKAFEKVKCKVVEAGYGQGGLEMINIVEFQKCLYLQWMGKLWATDNKDNWSVLPKWNLNKIANREKFFFS